jgi:hypothetical protein
MHTDEREAVLMNQTRERQSDDGLLFVYSYMNYFFLAPTFGCLPSFIIIASRNLLQLLSSSTFLGNLLIFNSKASFSLSNGNLYIFSNKLIFSQHIFSLFKTWIQALSYPSSLSRDSLFSATN